MTFDFQNIINARPQGHVLALCLHLGIDPADCLALGDADNDIEMLDFSGDSVAMEHGSAQAKAHAKRTARTADDVFRQILAELDA